MLIETVQLNNAVSVTEFYRYFHFPATGVRQDVSCGGKFAVSCRENANAHGFVHFGQTAHKIRSCFRTECKRNKHSSSSNPYTVSAHLQYHTIIIMNVEPSPTKNQQLLQAAKVGDWPAIQRALEEGGNINGRDQDSGPPIFEAISNEHWKVALQIVDVEGFNAKAKNEHGLTPLHCLCSRVPASSETEKDVQLLLLHDLVKASPDPHLESYGISPLGRAASTGNSIFVWYFLNFTDCEEINIDRAVLAAFKNYDEHDVSLPVLTFPGGTRWVC